MSVQKIRSLIECRSTGKAIITGWEGKPRQKLSDEHKHYLLSPSTLKSWGSKTLKERVALFNRKHGRVKISTSTLRNHYKKNDVKRKVFIHIKSLKIKDPEKHIAKGDEMKSQLRKALNQGRRIIYVDEAVFTTATLPSKAFALKGQNIELDEKLVSLPA